MKGKNLKERGITLIALVITIIVLLILAGVTLSIVLHTGIIDNSQKAVESFQIASAKEQIDMEIFGSYDGTGKININTLNDNLIKNLKNVYFKGQILSETNRIEELPVVVTYNGVEVKIGNGSGKFTNMITANNYGDKVKYTANGISDWKIFYNDNKNVFLISSDIIPNDKIANEKITKSGTYRAYLEAKNISTTVGASSVSDDIAQKFLWSYKSQYPTSLRANSRALSQMFFDTENWSNFVDPNYAEDAIGAPTLEMWIKSWNEKYPNDLLYYQIYDDLGYKISADNKNFDVNIPSEIIQAKDGWKYNRENNGDNLYFPRAIYFKDEDLNCYGYFLASNIYNEVENGIGMVDFSGLIHETNYFGGQTAFRPVVCLKSSVKANIGADGVWILEK